jgi:hypothetical protein
MQEALLHDCVVSSDVFTHLVDHLRDIVRPYQHALETEAGQHNGYRYLAGLLSHFPCKNAEDITTLVDVVRMPVDGGSLLGLVMIRPHHPTPGNLAGPAVHR